jgi:hypothetical protein
MCHERRDLLANVWKTQVTNPDSVGMVYIVSLDESRFSVSTYWWMDKYLNSYDCDIILFLGI